jgi:hypothetical protein
MFKIKVFWKNIDTILSGDAIVARTIEGKNLTKSEYVEHIEYFDESVADGSKTHTSEVIDHILVKKKKVNLISRSRMFTFYYF